MTQILIKFLIILGIFAFSCAGNRTSKNPLASSESLQEIQLTDKYWKLAEISGTPFNPPQKGDREPHLIFRPNEGRVIGSGGCNKFSGNYEVSDHRLHISGVISTKMACIGVDYEDDYLRMLESSEHFFVSDDSLYLLVKGCITARFVHSAAKNSD